MLTTFKLLTCLEQLHFTHSVLWGIVVDTDSYCAHLILGTRPWSTQVLVTECQSQLLIQSIWQTEGIPEPQPPLAKAKKVVSRKPKGIQIREPSQIQSPTLAPSIGT
jgi:hypothetical protein